jgi:hypothetical protein
MPTSPRRPAAQQERDRLEARRLRAAELFAFKAGGAEALRSRGPSGPAPRLSDTQLAQVEQALLEGATAHGFVGELMLL